MVTPDSNSDPRLAIIENLLAAARGPREDLDESPLYLPEQLREVALLENLLPPHYAKRESADVMVVGALSWKEASILRAFHENAFQIPPDKVRVAGCSISIPKEMILTMDRYDIAMGAPFDGDATQDFTWFYPHMEWGREDFQFDLTFIRNPDMYDLQTWSLIFYRAMEHTSSDGAVVTLIRRDDLGRYAKLLEFLREEMDIEPAFSGPTGAEDEFVHTIGIFKPKRPSHSEG